MGARSGVGNCGDVSKGVGWKVRRAKNAVKIEHCCFRMRPTHTSKQMRRKETTTPTLCLSFTEKQENLEDVQRETTRKAINKEQDE